MPERIAAVLVVTALRRRDHERPGLDRPCPDEDMPMRLTGRPGEGRRNRHHRRTRSCENTVKIWKTHVVADRQSEPRPRQVGDNRRIARPVEPRLAVALAAGEVDIEHMDLVVARGEAAVGGDQERPVGYPVFAEPDCHRADVEMAAEVLCERRGNGRARDRSPRAEWRKAGAHGRGRGWWSSPASGHSRRRLRRPRGSAVRSRSRSPRRRGRCASAPRRREKPSFRTTPSVLSDQNIGQLAARTTRAKTRTSTAAAPARTSARVAALTVAPVV